MATELMSRLAMRRQGVIQFLPPPGVAEAVAAAVQEVLPRQRRWHPRSLLKRECFAAGCANLKAANGKFCKARHHRPYESMRYQAQKAGEMVAFEQALRPRTK